MKKVVLLLTVLLLLGGARLIDVLAPAAEIVVEGMSPRELATLGLTTSSSTGLKVVGLGELVYLSGREKAGEAATGYAWTLKSRPASSQAKLDSTGTAWNTFRPDLEGKYEVELTLTTASGSSSASVAITAAKYVTVGQVDGVLFPDAKTGQCAACHSRQYEKWNETAHAGGFSRGVDGISSDHFASRCTSCHVLGFDQSPTAVNGGFDDIMAEKGWKFPEHAGPGEWDKLVKDYPDLARAGSVQCESCHGPGSMHKGDLAGTEVSMSEEVCAKCHDSGTHHVFSEQYKFSTHGTGPGASYAGARNGCADCHSSFGFVAKVDPQSNLSQKMGTEGITCAACHDPHEHTGAHQLRETAGPKLANNVQINWGGTGQLCMNCHVGRRDAETYAVPANASSHFGPHYSNQADMLAGSNAITFGRYIPSSTHRNALDDSCVDCHMTETPAVGEPGYNQLGSHSWNMSYEVNGQHLDNVAACVDCHGSIESFDDILAREDYDGDKTVESAKAELHGLLEEVGMLLPPMGDPHVVVTKDFTPLQMKAAFNWKFVEEDGSEGMHNFQYAIGLLKVTKDVLTYGVLTPGAVTAVNDVPNDQGKQVSVAWSRFGGDGPSDNPIQQYYVWRKIDEAAAGKDQKVLSSLDEIPLEAAKAQGVVAQFADGLWTVVGTQPAARMERYAAIVPTLFDSTLVGGQHLSTFMVSGHTAVSTVFAMSEPMAGYSMDNLAPSAPSGVVASAADAGIALKWNPMPDPDIDYVLVYRGTTPGFSIADLAPVAKLRGNEYVDLAVERGKTYVYKLVAYDFSGNRGAYSAEVTTAVSTDVDQLAGGIPSTFVLAQNFPNPFNPSTQITYGVPEAGHVRIAVYDLSGKEVGVLVDQHQAPGRYQVSWHPQQLASGVYFYKMEARNFVQVKTMMLLK